MPVIGKVSLKNSIEIEKPLSEVFTFVSDQLNNPKWNYYVMRVEKINGLDGVGAEYLQTRKNDRQKFVIEEFVRDKKCVIQTLPGERPAARRSIVFEGGDHRTILYDQIELQVPVPSFFAKLFIQSPKNAIRQNLQKLKELLETGLVVLQDGREMSYKMEP